MTKKKQTSMESPQIEDINCSNTELEENQKMKENNKNPFSQEEIVNIPVNRVKVPLYFEVGRTRLTFKELSELSNGSILETNRLVGEELELYAGNVLIATGEVVVVNEKFGAKITSILNDEDRKRRLER